MRVHHRPVSRTFTLKFEQLQLLKDHDLRRVGDDTETKHVDCTTVISTSFIFAKNCFMASRDRLKDGKESRELRKRLGKLLKDGRLKEIYKARKAQISVDDADADDLLRNLTSNLPFRNELMRLFDHTLKLKGSGRGDRKKKRPKKPTSKRREPPPFSSSALSFVLQGRVVRPRQRHAYGPDPVGRPAHHQVFDRC